MRENHKFTIKAPLPIQNPPAQMFSIRKREVMPPHGTKMHVQKRQMLNWWYLLEGAYFLCKWDNRNARYAVTKLVISFENGEFHERFIFLKTIPCWLARELTATAGGKYETYDSETRYASTNYERLVDMSRTHP